MRNPFLGIAALALFPLPVLAQSAGADRIDAIERHIRQLEDELQRLKRELRDTRQKRFPPRAAAFSGLAEWWRFELSISAW